MLDAEQGIWNRPFQGFLRHLVGGAKILGRARGQTVKTWRMTVDRSTVDNFVPVLASSCPRCVTG